MSSPISSKEGEQEALERVGGGVRVRVWKGREPAEEVQRERSWRGREDQ